MSAAAQMKFVGFPARDHQSRAARALRYGAILFLCSWVAFYLVSGFAAAYWFDGAPGNGPFQMLNPLRRIAAGQTPGTDFVFYHGVGLPYLYYPIFAFSGKNLAASELSRQWTTCLFFFGTAVFFVRALLGKSPWWPVALAGLIGSLELAFPAVATPGLSQVASRSTMPLLVFAILLLPITERRKAVLSGLVLGIAWICGTEHGISLTLAFLVTGMLSLWHPARIKHAQLLLLTLGTAAVTATAAFLLVCGPAGAAQALHYALVELPSDKFWFDGAPPNPYLGTWNDLFSSRHFILPLLPTLAALVLLGIIARWFWRSRASVFGDQDGVMCLMLVYGLLSGIPLLGVFSKHYVLPLVRVLAFVALILAVRYRHLLHWWPRITQGFRWSGAAAFAIVALVLMQATVVRAYALNRHLTADSYQYSNQVDARWDSFMAQATAALGPGRPRLWSTYSGLLEAHYGIFAPAEDYITIAAGAERRRQYVEKFRAAQPRTVQTMTKDFPYEEWLQNVRWEFYEDLLNNYQVAENIGHALFWSRKPGPWQTPSNDFKTLPVIGGKSVTIPAANLVDDEIGVARVSYRPRNPWQGIPLFGMTPRYMVSISGSRRHCMISLPPYEAQFQFPVQIPSRGAMELRFETQSLFPNVELDVTKFELKRLPAEPSHPALRLTE